MSRIPNFAIDKTGAYPDCTLFAIPAEGIEWICGVLNSSVFNLLASQTMPRLESGSYRYKTIYLEQLPIPTPTPAQILALESFTDDSRLPELNALVYDLYGLNPDERALVEELTAGAYGTAGAGAADMEDDNEGMETQ